jgi:hypothetical protein
VTVRIPAIAIVPLVIADAFLGGALGALHQQKIDLQLYHRKEQLDRLERAFWDQQEQCGEAVEEARSTLQDCQLQCRPYP